MGQATHKLRAAKGLWQYTSAKERFAGLAPGQAWWPKMAELDFSALDNRWAHSPMIRRR